MILVAGQQSSGNRLIRDQIRAALLAARMRETVLVWHGDSLRRYTPDGEGLRIVIPVRSEAMRRRSVDKTRSGITAFDGQRIRAYPDAADKQRQRVFATIAAENIPAYVLSYEALVRYPALEGRILFEWLGIPWIPWAVDLYDANEAHE